MRVPVFEDVRDEAEEEKTGEEENEEDMVSEKASAEKGICSSTLVIRQNVSFPCVSGQVFFKPVIEDLSMELARKCTKLISDVSGLSTFCLILHCVCGTVMS